MPDRATSHWPATRRSVLQAAGAVFAAGATAPSAILAQQEAALDRAHLAPTFHEDFQAPVSFYNIRTGQGRWKTNYDFGWQLGGPSSRTLPGELQVYSDPAYNGVNPFTCQDGVFGITATRNPRPHSPDSAGRPYISGLITTSPSFRQRYGYFEIRAELPAGAGLWPAFWLAVPLRPDITTPQFPGEIDVVESLGKDPDRIYCSAHWPTDPAAAHADFRTIGCDAPGTGQPHRYGMLWTREHLRWFRDDQPIAQMDNPGLHRPMAILANLAVGGTWGGPPDAATRFPATMRIHHIRAWQMRA